MNEGYIESVIKPLVFFELTDFYIAFYIIFTFWPADL